MASGRVVPGGSTAPATAATRRRAVGNLDADGPVRIGAVVDKLAVNADDTVALAEVVQVLLRGGRV